MKASPGAGGFGNRPLVEDDNPRSRTPAPGLSRSPSTTPRATSPTSPVPPMPPLSFPSSANPLSRFGSHMRSTSTSGAATARSQTPGVPLSARSQIPSIISASPAFLFPFQCIYLLVGPWLHGPCPYLSFATLCYSSYTTSLSPSDLLLFLLTRCVSAPSERYIPVYSSLFLVIVPGLISSSLVYICGIWLVPLLPPDPDLFFTEPLTYLHTLIALIEIFCFYR